MHVIDDSVLGPISTNEARTGQSDKSNERFSACQGTCVAWRSHGTKEVPFTATNVVLVAAIGTRTRA
jgi:hypothetical protein